MSRAVTRNVCAALVGAACALAGLAANAPPAAASITCTNNSAHCYSVLRASGTTFYGMYGTWARAAMNAPGSDYFNGYFITSEMWAMPAGAGWVETGLAQGYFDPTGLVGYYALGVYGTASGGYAVHSFGLKPQNATVTDEFQISRGTSANTWRVYCDGALWTTPALGFWTVNWLDVGSEVYGSSVTASQFTMYVKGFNSASAKVNLGFQFAEVSPGMNGSSPANSTWRWSVR